MVWEAPSKYTFWVPETKAIFAGSGKRTAGSQLRSYRVEVYVSLDGPPDVHDPVRLYPSGRGSHAEVQASLSLLRTYGYSPRILAVIGRHNVAQPQRLLAHLEELGVEAVRFNPILRTGRAAGSWPDYGISPEEYFTFMTEALDWLAEHRSVEEDTLQFLLLNLLYRLRMYRCQRSNCGAGRNYVAVDAEGNIHPCAMHRKNLPALQLGNVPGLGERHAAAGGPPGGMDRDGRRAVLRLGFLQENLGCPSPRGRGGAGPGQGLGIFVGGHLPGTVPAFPAGWALATFPAARGLAPRARFRPDDRRFL